MIKLLITAIFIYLLAYTLLILKELFEYLVCRHYGLEIKSIVIGNGIVAQSGNVEFGILPITSLKHIAPKREFILSSNQNRILLLRVLSQLLPFILTFVLLSLIKVDNIYITNLQSASLILLLLNLAPLDTKIGTSSGYMLFTVLAAILKKKPLLNLFIVRSLLESKDAMNKWEEYGYTQEDLALSYQQEIEFEEETQKLIEQEAVLHKLDRFKPKFKKFSLFNKRIKIVNADEEDNKA